MKLRPCLSLLALTLTALATLVDAAPSLDLVANSSGFVDQSSAGRRVRLNHVSPSESLTVRGRAYPSNRVANNNGITVDMAKNDPLSEPQQLTYATLVRFDDIPTLKGNNTLIGRWQISPPCRSSALIFNGATGQIQYLLSADGTAESCTGGSTKKPVPAGEWLIMVMSWKPGTISFGIYQTDGTVVEENTVADKRAPAAIFGNNQPLVMGSPAEFGLQVARVQAYATYMKPIDAARALLTTP